MNNLLDEIAVIFERMGQTSQQTNNPKQNLLQLLLSYYRQQAQVSVNLAVLMNVIIL